MKNKIILITASLFAIFIVYVSYNLFKYRSIIFSSSGNLMQSIQQIKKIRYNEGKGIRVYLKTGVSDKEGVIVSEELNDIVGVNGVSFLAKNAQQTIEENILLYPEKIGSLIPGSHVIIDVFVENVKEKESIIQEIKKNTRVEVVADIKKY